MAKVKRIPKNDRSIIPVKPSINSWYLGLKKDDTFTANAWLSNLKLTQTLYGKSPGDLAEMKPEEAYNFVLQMVREMQNDGRSLSHIQDMIKSVSDWLEFNGSMETDTGVLRELPYSMTDEETSNLPSDRLMEQKQILAGKTIQDRDLFTLLAEKSETILDAHGLDFVNKLRDIENLLASIDPAPDTIIGSIDKSVNKGVEMDLGAYYLAAYSSSRDLSKSLLVYRLTNALMRYIALTDEFYETGDKVSLKRANILLQELNDKFTNQMRYTIKISIEKFWPFWMFENMMKQRMLDGESFGDKELRYFILMKSSDTPLLYCTILDGHLETFSPNVAMAFHYNQALIDILDDYYDIEEDIQSRMPNIFLMASNAYAPSLDEQGNPGRTLLDVTKGNAKKKILSLVDWFAIRLGELALPVEYQFLRNVTGDHIHKLKNILA
jgi:hypothetical protein